VGLSRRHRAIARSPSVQLMAQGFVAISGRSHNLHQQW